MHSFNKYVFFEYRVRAREHFKFWGKQQYTKQAKGPALVEVTSHPETDDDKQVNTDV